MTTVGNVGGDFSGLLFGKLYTVQACFSCLFAGAAARAGCAGIEGQAFSASWQTAWQGAAVSLQSSFAANWK